MAGDSRRRGGLIEAAAADGIARGEGRLVGVSKFTAAVLFNGLGRYEEAFAAARECCEYEDLGFHSWCLYELIEAATHLGDQAVRRGGPAPLRGAGGRGWNRLGVGRGGSVREPCSPTTSDAEGFFAEAIERLERANIVLHLARTRLSYGEWLRRVNRRLDARQQLNTAHEMFTRMGAQGFAERARRELVATGEKVRKQPLSSGDELTAQEAQIARLAADGLTNSGDRRAAVHQHAHRRMAPAEGLRQARHHLAQAAPHRVVGELGPRPQAC